MAMLRLSYLRVWPGRRTCTRNVPFLFAIGEFRKGALVDLLFYLSIFVDNHSINHHIVSCANVVNADWSPYFHFRPYDILIEHFAASRHVSDGLAKMVSPRAAAFLKHDDAARSVLRDSPPPSVVVVVVVVSETCAHAKGAAIARAMLSNVFFILCFLFYTN